MKKLTKSDIWFGILWTFIADLLNEWGFPKICENLPLNKFFGSHSNEIDLFLKRVDSLYLITDIARKYSEIINSQNLFDADKIQEIELLLNKIDSKISILKFKENITLFLKH